MGKKEYRTNLIVEDRIDIESNHCGTKRCITFRKSIVISVCLLLSIVTLALIVFNLTYHKNNESVVHSSANKIQTDWPNTICFPCDELSPDVSKNGTLFVVNASCTPQLCCLKEAGNLRKLFYLMLNDHYKSVKKDNKDVFKDAHEDKDQKVQATAVSGQSDDGDKNFMIKTPENKGSRMISEFWMKRVDAAHLFVNTTSLISSRSGSIPWDDRTISESSMISTNISYNATTRSLRVGYSGVYFMYSAVAFKSETTTGPLTSPIYHTISRTHHLLPKSGEELLMMNKYGREQQSHGYYTSFLCGSLLLRKDDELAVKVSNHTIIENFYYSNYFGIFKL